MPVHSLSKISIQDIWPQCHDPGRFLRKINTPSFKENVHKYGVLLEKKWIQLLIIKQRFQCFQSHPPSVIIAPPSERELKLHTGLSSVTSHCRYSATCIIWLMIWSSSCRGKNILFFSTNTICYKQHSC